MATYDELRERLEEERVRLQADLQVELPDFADDSSPGYGNHPADISDEVYDQQNRLTLRRRLEESLEAINRALEKMDQHTYGICEACGREIDPARLEAMPEVRFCLEDQQKLEQLAGVDTDTMLGSRQTSLD